MQTYSHIEREEREGREGERGGERGERGGERGERGRERREGEGEERGGERERERERETLAKGPLMLRKNQERCSCGERERLWQKGAFIAT